MCHHFDDDDDDVAQKLISPLFLLQGLGKYNFPLFDNLIDHSN